MQSVLKADFYYYRKYVHYLLFAVSILPVVMGVYVCLQKEALAEMDRESQIKCFGNIMTIGALMILVFVLYILGALIKSGLLKYQYFVKRNRKSIITGLFTVVSSVGCAAYLMASLLGMGVICGIMQGGIESSCFFQLLRFTLFQMMGVVRLLLITALFFTILDRLSISIFMSALFVTLMSLFFAGITYFAQSKEMAIFLVKVLVCCTAASLGYSGIILDFVNPVVLMVCCIIELCVIWMMGVFFFEYKEIR